MPSAKSRQGEICLTDFGLGISSVAMMRAAIRKDSELTTKATSRPKVADTMPPSADPTISMMPHVEPLRALAANSSSGLTMLGMLALLAGAKNETDTASKIEATY